ncbi:MAG: GNAT family N-acetyltransferase [Sphingomonadales bacterium]|nr:GNAT family N-acetyltransferase [Sphingomonadales bacterium]MBU3992240.1 GNAT family N-acetyltransferase [Alphaproteobacteria bacterium]
MSEHFHQAPRRLSIRLAHDDADLAAVQRLRWRVFFAERGAGGVVPASGPQAPQRDAPERDADDYDALCDHLLVIDEDAPAEDRVVGTYRLLRESIARTHTGFYSAGEFDLAALTEGPARPAGELLELGRSCVLARYRTSATIALLWRGIADYIARHGIGLMFGCASFPGTDVAAHAPGLSYLYHHHLADPAQRPRVLTDRVAAGSTAPLEQLAPGTYDERRALFQLPPLVKGYLRAGATFGDGAYIDGAFNTIDVCVVLPVDRIAGRYAARFSAAA